MNQTGWNHSYFYLKKLIEELLVFEQKKKRTIGTKMYVSPPFLQALINSINFFLIYGHIACQEYASEFEDILLFLDACRHI